MLTIQVLRPPLTPEGLLVRPHRRVARRKHRPLTKSMRSPLFMKKRLSMPLLILLLGVLAACTSSAPLAEQTNSENSPALPPLDAAQVTLGETIYAQNCASCHGKNLEGEVNWKTQNEDGSFRAPPHTADGHTWHHSDEQLLEAIELGGARLPNNIGGASTMPAFGEILTDEEMTAVLAYIKSQWPEDIRAVQWQVTAQTTSP